MQKTTNKLMDFLAGDWRGELGEIASKNESRDEGECWCTGCDNQVLCEHEENEEHFNDKSCSNCGK